MRNISFSMTTEQFRARRKDVTRRLGWENVKVGELLQGCEKCQGLRQGDVIVRIHVVQVVNVRRESLSALRVGDYGKREMIREGFPGKDVDDFIKFFCAANKCTEHKPITRIAYKFVDPAMTAAQLAAFNSSDFDMRLPPGKSCADCVSCARCCAMFIGAAGKNNGWCDFSPSRFHERSGEKQ
jgi:hypothetical protein